MKASLFYVGIPLLALCAASAPCHAQEVYVGTGNGRDAMMAHPQQWQFVRQNADGFYVNFIQMLKMDKEKCAKMANLFTHKNAFFESDSRNTGLGGFPDGGQFSRALQAEELTRLLDGGFAVPFASLNYGVSAEKKTDLQHLGMKDKALRPVFAQFGPWNFGGDIKGDAGKDNARTRRLIEENDGGVTDGPMGFWQSDYHKMREGSISLAQFCREHQKKSVVMVCPYGAGNTNYDFGQWLAQAQKCVRDHEDAGAVPDVWAVFEYATSVPALPETTEGGRPANTTMGAAYWLIHHLRDPNHDAQMTAAEDVSKAQKNRRVVRVTVRNRSTWLDLCPGLEVHVSGDERRNWSARFMADKDEPLRANKSDWLPLTGGLRLWPGATRTVQIIMERRPLAEGTLQESIPTPAPIFVGLHPSANPERQSLTQIQTVRFAPLSPALRKAK